MEQNGTVRLRLFSLQSGIGVSSLTARKWDENASKLHMGPAKACAVRPSDARWGKPYRGTAIDWVTRGYLTLCSHQRYGSSMYSQASVSVVCPSTLACGGSACMWVSYVCPSTVSLHGIGGGGPATASTATGQSQH